MSIDEDAVSMNYEGECKRLEYVCKEKEAQIAEMEQLVAELKSHLEYKNLQLEREIGKVEALKFAIRCNGVSGGEVTE